MKRHFSLVLATAFLVTSNAAHAGPDELARDAAVAEAAKLRSEGWPKAACYAGVRFFNNTVVEGNGTLLAGDTLVSINSTPVERSTTKQIGDLIGSIAPNAALAIQVRRGGQSINLSQTCGNLADVQSPYLQALDFAGKKRWAECINALSGSPDNPQYAHLRIRCAKVSRKPDAYPVQQWSDRAMQGLIAAGSYAPESRGDLALSLLKTRIELSQSAYEQLLGQVKAWDGSKTWNSVQPDIAALRRAAERGVKNRLIDPQSAIIEMPFDFIYGTWTPVFSGTHFEGFMTCGSVNAKNRMGGYTGASSFVAVIDGNGTENFVDMDSGSSQYFRPVDTACGNLIKKLKFVGDAPASDAPAGSTGATSMAEELEKLAKLHSSGALNDAEYSAAKAKVLSGK